MSLGVGTVGHVRFVVSVLLEFVEYLLKRAACVPAAEASVNGLPGTETFRQIPPRSAGLGNVEDGIQERSGGQFRGPARASPLGREERFEPGPLVVAQFVAVHRRVWLKFSSPAQSGSEARAREPVSRPPLTFTGPPGSENHDSQRRIPI